MKKASLLDDIEYKENRPTISVLFETEFTKEIRIAFSAGQKMKEHKTGYPITVEIFEGNLDFGINGAILKLKKGDILGLEPNVLHDLTAKTNCIVRLSLTKKDSVQRVIGITKG